MSYSLGSIPCTGSKWNAVDPGGPGVACDRAVTACTRPGTIPLSVASILQRTAIGLKRRIGAHQQQRFTDRLGHQQAVKRIAVMERQLLERQQVGEVKGRELKAALLSPRNRLGGRERHIADQHAAGLSGDQVATTRAQPWFTLIAQRKAWVSSRSRIRPVQTARRSADWRHRSTPER